MKKIACTTLMLMGLIATQSVVAQSIEQILQQHYPKYNQKHQCFIGSDQQYKSTEDVVEGDYCLKVDAQKTINTANGKMHYILLAGGPIDLGTGELLQAHVASGVVDMLVLKEAGKDSWELAAAQGGIAVGAFGEAPSGWQLQQFGTDAWGFLNSAGDAHQGYSGSYYVILLPVGNTIYASRIVAEADNSGALGDCSAEDGFETKADQASCAGRRETLSSTLKIDRRGAVVSGMYPLQLTVNGVSGKKKWKDHVVTIPFDAQKHKYLDPESSPLFGAEF